VLTFLDWFKDDPELNGFQVWIHKPCTQPTDSPPVIYYDTIIFSLVNDIHMFGEG